MFFKKRRIQIRQLGYTRADDRKMILIKKTFVKKVGKCVNIFHSKAPGCIPP